MNEEKFEREELNAWKYALEYFTDVLNGDLELDEARKNLLSFRNSEYYTGTNPNFRV